MNTSIQKLFGPGTVVYDASIGAYTDDRGYQYTVTNGFVMGRQIGVSSKLNTIWENTHPYLQNPETEAAALLLFTTQQAQGISDHLVQQLWPDQKSTILVTRSIELQTDVKVGFLYTLPETKKKVLVVVDRVKGEIINYSQDL